MPAATWQPSLLDLDHAPACVPGVKGARRRFLGSGAWLELVPGWLSGADELFEQLLTSGRWATRERRMFDRTVVEPRLSTGQWSQPPHPCPELARALAGRYGLDLSAVSANLYRDGRDSVAWHGDTLGRYRAETVVAIVSLGSPRRMMLRPKGGGSSIRVVLEPGDLIVMGGTCQHTWEHCIPKCASAGSRISLMFREPGVR